MSSGRNLEDRNKRCRLFDLATYVAEDVEADLVVVRNVVKLLENQNTVPFIARYRREQTKNLEVEKIRMIQEVLNKVKIIEDRKESVLKAIGEKCTPELIHSLKAARTMQDVEDIYAPFKTGSKGTLANRARQLGLDGAVLMIQENPKVFNLNMFVKSHQKGLSTPNEVSKGVQHIFADIISKDQEILSNLRDLFESNNVALETKVTKNSANDTKYKDYHDKNISLKFLKAHQVLAVNRAEENKIVSVKMNCPPAIQRQYMYSASRKFISSYSSDFVRKLMENSLCDSFDRLMLPKLIRHKRAELTKNAERESVQVFSRNLRRLLLTPPVQGRTILGIDPGFKHGCKIAVIDKNGDILAADVIYPFSGNTRTAETKLVGLLTTHNCNTVALGNGTACRETEGFITKMKETGKLKRDVVYSIVSEDGASVYSVSEEAKEDLPGLDVNIRSAVSIARRLQNPLLELIKIDPKHLGVGMYQHDIPDNLLKTALSGVLEDCVSLVGVDLNVSGVHALKRIAGLNERKAKAIVTFRNSHGPFVNREQLKKVSGIGEKTFEQCAGFVRILRPPPDIIILEDSEDSDLKPRSSKMTGKRKAVQSGASKKKRKHENLAIFNPLDSTCIHPESYALAQRLVTISGANLADIGQPRMKEQIDKLVKENGFSNICTMLNSNVETVECIITGLCRSVGGDIRADFVQPLFRQGVRSVDDLKPKSQVTGRVNNVTTFGAFVDIGVGRDGLIHISNIPAKVLPVLGAGDIVEVTVLNVKDTRIGLSLQEVKNSNVDLR